MKKTTAVLLDLLYPRRCALCDRLLPRKERSVCGACRAGLDVRIHRFPGALLPARVLVVDDIFTSGATVREMTRALRAAGVREVFAACAALA